MIPRLHLFELEDQRWFPAAWRNFMTDYLRHVEGVFGLHRHVLEPLSGALRDSGARRIVDLGSGAAGPLEATLEHWPGESPAEVVLTDLFPNEETARRIEEDGKGRIRYWPAPVNMLAVPGELTGLRTIFNALHHFRPEEARAALADAVRARQPIAVFEVAERRAVAILPLVLVPLFVLVLTPFIKPFRWSRLFWTYLIPVLPPAILWDGVVSYLRAYTEDELLAMAKAVDAEGYRWTAGRSQAEKVPGAMTYLIGLPG